MTRFADSQTESRISGIESELSRKAESHEISTLRSDVARLEHSLREAISEIDGLRNEQTQRTRIRKPYSLHVRDMKNTWSKSACTTLKYSDPYYRLS